MKTKVFGKLALVACSALVISACNDSERIAEYNKLTLDKNEAVFDLDKTENLTTEFNITEGNGNYKVSVEDAEVAEVSIDGTKVTVTALRVGETTAKVYDWVKQSAEIRIKVIDKFELSDSELEMLYGEIRSIEIYSGNGDYQVASSNEEVATVVVEGGFINITAVGAGEADVTVTDAEGKTTTIKVIVSLRDITFSEESPLEMAMSQTKEIEITSGNGEYTLQNSDPTVVKAELTEDGKIKIESLKDGVAELTVTDQAGVSAILTVNVKVVDITLSKDAVEVNMNKTAEVEILTGNGEYTFESNASDIATAELTEDRKILIKGLKEGNAEITITDKAGRTKVLSVTVKTVELILEETVIEEIISSDKTGITIPITSGNGGYQITANLPLVASISEDQQSVILKPENVGSLGYNLKATLTDASGKTVEITVKIMHKNYLETLETRYFVNGIFKGKDKVQIDWNNDTGVRREFILICNNNFFGKPDEGYKIYFECEGHNGIVEGPATFAGMDVYKTSYGTISNLVVDKVTDQGIWVSFQEEGISTRSYIVVKR